MRPLETLLVSHPNDRESGDGPIASVMLAAAALGMPACALCRDPSALPVLAGDRARGPDHLYLICDRCGGPWQRWEA
ncbi:MAG TPA: hypothetical protein VL308_19525 [Gemmatimonadaceae bacterium]|jgi:hypothetical protein|nr:hypothetical protein [Gemmatimonadaceae bacterium]